MMQEHCIYFNEVLKQNEALYAIYNMHYYLLLMYEMESIVCESNLRKWIFIKVTHFESTLILKNRFLAVGLHTTEKHHKMAF